MGVENDHNCECSACVERSEILRELFEELTPGTVLTIGGRPIDHSKLNELRTRARKSGVR